MANELRLVVTFDGEGSGLERQRLQVDAFAPALIKLQRAYRQIAQRLVHAATGNESERGSPGRYSRFVKGLAWEIDTISHNSPVQIALACPVPTSLPGANFELFSELTIDRAADELISSLEAEASGVPRSAAVRRFLRALPDGVRHQSYRLTKLDGEVREVNFGRLERDELNVEFPSFVVQSAVVAGLHFPPAPPEVRFLDDERRSVTAAAPEELVEKALRHRSEPMTGLFVKEGKRLRALWLVPGADRPAPPSPEKRLAYLTERWADTIKLLAE